MTAKPTAERTPKSSEPTSAIELSTIYWHSKPLGGDLALLDTSLKLPHVAEGLVALFGRRGRQEGFMAARDHTLDRNLQYTVVDLKVALATKPSGISRHEGNISEQEVLPVHNLTAEYATALSDRIRRDMRLARYASGEVNANSLLETLMLHPGAIKRLLAYPEFDHIKVLVFQGTPSFSTEAFPLAWIPPKHLGSIVVAESRLDPDVRITLPSADRELDKGRSKPALVPVTSSTPRPRG